MTTQTTTRTAADIAARLNAYEQEWMDKPYSASDPYDIMTLAESLPEYSADGTFTADMNGNGDVVVLKSGDTIRWSTARQAWCVEVEPDPVERY